MEQTDGEILLEMNHVKKALMAPECYRISP